MSDKLTSAIVLVITIIVGVSALAIFVSKKSDTVNVLTASGSAFAKILGTAVTPILNSSSGLGSLGSLSNSFSFLN